MKTLTLIRHAKSAWDNPALSDFDRTLNDRGQRDAPRIGRKLKQSGMEPDHLVSSPARRAKSTTDIIANELELPESAIQLEPRIYNASVTELLGVIRSWPSSWKNVILVGHNPGLSDLLEKTTGSPPRNLPTCGVVQVSVPGEWSKIDRHQCEILVSIEPRRLDEP